MAALSSPMQFGRRPVRKLMLLVLAATAPAVIVHTWFFGIGMLINIVLAMILGALAESFALLLRGKPVKDSLSDNSLLVTALLLGVAMPPGAPWWLLLLGILFAVLIAKQAFGGLGHNVFNPAMAGYLFLLLSYPLEMTSWHLPYAATDPAASFSPLSFNSMGESLQLLIASADIADGMAMATPLIESKMAVQSAVLSAFDEGLPLFSRQSETGWELVNWAYLLGGLFLLLCRIISWHIPVAVIGSVLAMSLLFYAPGNSSVMGTPYLHLFGSATMIGAFFIATDPVTAATSRPAKLAYGILIGISIYAIRVWGSYLDSIAIAVLFGNFCAPLLDHWLRPTIFGHGRRKDLRQTRQAES